MGIETAPAHRSDVDFSMYTLVAGTISNAAYAMYSIRAKHTLEALGRLSPRAMYALLTFGGCITLAPFALLFELTGTGASQMAASSGKRLSGWPLAGLLIFTGLMQYLSNEIAFCTLSVIHPVTYAVTNTLKRSIVVAVSLLVFGNRLPPLGMMGAAIAIAGAFAYSLSTHYVAEAQRNSKEKL
jgi:solute carrier family 35 protein E1